MKLKKNSADEEEEGEKEKESKKDATCQTSDRQTRTSNVNSAKGTFSQSRR